MNEQNELKNELNIQNELNRQGWFNEQNQLSKCGLDEIIINYNSFKKKYTFLETYDENISKTFIYISVDTELYEEYEDIKDLNFYDECYDDDAHSIFTNTSTMTLNYNIDAITVASRDRDMDINSEISDVYSVYSSTSTSISNKKSRSKKTNKYESNNKNNSKIQKKNAVER